jgi:hypothetical protein
MRGVAYPIGERELLMRLHEQGASFSALSRQTGIRPAPRSGGSLDPFL